MRRYFIKFSYLGSQYRGMQKNAIPNGNVIMYDSDTIQGALENAFSTVVPKCVLWPKITCSSRTDAGVHGLCNTAHVDIENKYDCIYNPNHVLKSVNKYFNNCNHNIRLLEFIPVKDNFNARTLAKSRTYIYRILRPKNIDNHKIPIAELSQSFCIKSETFDLERIKCATQLFMGTKDFRTFSGKYKSSIPIQYVRKLDSLTLENSYPLMLHDPLSHNFEYWNFICSARSFLYNQVRRIVGSLVALGKGKITEKDINVMLQVPNHNNWLPYVTPVPPDGLYLVNVEYCQKELDEYIINYKICDDWTVVPVD